MKKRDIVDLTINYKNFPHPLTSFRIISTWNVNFLIDYCSSARITFSMALKKEGKAKTVLTTVALALAINDEKLLYTT